jgi:hypothetical protein
MRIWLSFCLAVALTISAWGSVLDIGVGDKVNARLDSALKVSPRVGGVTVSLNGTTYGNSSANVNIGADAVWIGCYRYDIEGYAEDYKTFCLDLTKGVTYTYTLHTAYTTLSSLEYMWGTYYDSIVNDAVKAAAFQLAVWELVHDNGTDVGSGNFYLYDLDTSSPNNNLATKQGLIDQANAYLDRTKWITKVDLLKLSDGINQPFAVVVPEPVTIGLLACCGLMLFRRKK